MDFTPGTQTFRDLMGNGRMYVVPRFQRDYAWDQEQWLDLWEDILAAAEPGAQPHYMGYLVLQRSPDGGRMSVIDGQQRLATLSLLVIAAMYELKSGVTGTTDPESPDAKRGELLRGKFLTGSNAADLSTFHKLRLNRNNEAIFRTLARLGEAQLRGSRPAERRLVSACRFLRERLRESGRDGEAMTRLVEDASARLFFTTLEVSSDLDAFRVFETLNARGVQLSTPDLVKNFLFSRIDSDTLQPSDLEELDLRWSRIAEQLGSLPFGDFVLTEWNRRNKQQTKRNLFRAIRSGVSGAEEASAYLERLEEASGLYAALHDPEDAFWRQDDQRRERQLRLRLRGLRLFQISQPQGLLMTVWQEGGADDFRKALGWIYAFSMRYQVIGNGAHQKLITAYHQAADSYQSSGRVQDVRDALQPLYPDDEAFFRDALEHSVQTLRSEKRARHLLARLEEQASGGEPVADENLTLEHVLPRRPTRAWLDAFGDHADADVDRLGNLALLPRSANQQIGRVDFAQKRAALEASGLLTNRLDADAWTHHAVEDRQRRLAGLAVQAWRIEFPER